MVIPIIPHPFVPMHPQAISISDLGLTDWIDVKSTLRQICWPMLCIDFSWSYIDFLQVYDPPP